MTTQDTDILDRGVARGVITAAQRDALRELGSGSHAPAEVTVAFSGVTVAYGLGALLVLFAAGWFLVSRWASLGHWGVLAAVTAYGVMLWGGGHVLERRGFPRAGQLAVALAIGLVPVATWAILHLAGEWPERGDPLALYLPYAASRGLILDLTTLLVALLAWRSRAFPLLMVPIAVALWWTWFHLGQLVAFDRERAWFDQWLMLAAGLALLAGADAMDRWQRRRAPGDDYAAPLWITAVFAFSFAFLVIWMDSRAAKHTMAPVALGLIALALRTRRRAALVVGIAGVFGYLAWLASDVFEDTALFPVALAGLGIGLIFTTVWLQRRFPALATRVGGLEGRDLPGHSGYPGHPPSSRRAWHGRR
ncbi:MAG: hypothetical protein IPK85_11115 [Gemmatimonadetes bacterium]|nr:hypothetical protein [Gemmatimonadota bacterium]